MNHGTANVTMYPAYLVKAHCDGVVRLEADGEVAQDNVCSATVEHATREVKHLS